MALRDTSWITSGGVLQTGNSILIDKQAIEERVYFFPIGTYTRTRTILTREWVAVTQDAASNAVDCHAGDTNSRVRAVETSRFCDGYKFVQDVDSYDSYTLET